MGTEHIIALLIQERDRLNKAIDALGGGAPVKRLGRPQKSALADAPDWVTSAGVTPAKSAPKKKGRREFTPEQRAEQAKRMKAYWAKKRKAK